ncbi:hypothetical protein [Methylobacterium soli]|uniref:Uncharacterized protein n=1 Tax=Methylobacterium soli TaxID=553447 RepID=A0A6L3SU94_9HYPH|nr:hypothetical protein [Methylobacterium soli]KAB1074957.1 hypothetical protein F6X53_25210 [Methylobacterium soli]
MPSPAAPSGLWAGLNLQGDLTDRPETPPPSEAEAPRKVETRASEPEKRRVLPSLLAPAPEPVETDAAPSAEPRLPRVRRVAAKPRPQAQPAWAEALAEPDAPAPLRSGIVVPPAQSAPEASDQGASELALARLRRERRGLPGLRAGERWKRRLPRSCW